MPATVFGALVKPSENALYPTIRFAKSGMPPKGCTGFAVRLTPRTTSAAVTWRAGVVLHLAPGRILIVYVLPSALTSPFAVVGISVARSATGFVLSLPGSAGYVNSWRLHIRRFR